MLTEMNKWNDGLDTIEVPDGYHMKSVPDLTRANFQTLIERHNQMVALVNLMAEKLGVSIKDLTGE